MRPIQVIILGITVFSCFGAIVSSSMIPGNDNPMLPIVSMVVLGLTSLVGMLTSEKWLNMYYNFRKRPDKTYHLD